jgi:ADP-L-glycero-D-manno-heptose 6-epimerase
MIDIDHNFNGKTILITGGAGFIGSNIAIYLQENFPKSIIVIFDCFRNEERFSNGNLKSFGHFQNLIGFSGDVICGNINSKDDLNLLNQYKFDYIFHHAAISDTRVYDQEIILRTNLNSFHNILQIALKDKAKLVYASSAALYGNLPPPQVEGNERPENPYGYSKYLMDQIAKRYISIYPELSIVGLRFFNVYGAKEFYKSNTSSMIIQLGHQILRGQAPRLFKNSHLIMRDFVYIKDVIQANILACNPIQNGIYNIGTGISRSFQDVSDILQKEFGTDLGTEYFMNPYTGYQSNTKASIFSSKKNLGYKPNFSLEEGINDYIPEIVNTFGKDFQ